jgi:ribonuclease E
MADIKQIHVTVTPQDEKSFSRTVKGTRKRKEQKHLEGMPTMEPKQVAQPSAKVEQPSAKVEQPSAKVEQPSAKVEVLPTKKVAESKKADDTKKVEAAKKVDDPKRVEVTKKPDEKENVPDQPLVTIHAKKFSTTEKKPSIHKILPSKKHLSAAPSALSL